MDKLRAMEYFVRVASFGTFTAAARDLDVSVPAVTKMIAALERDLGTQLLRRTSRHLSLTTDGDDYLVACETALDTLHAAEGRLSSIRTRASGKLVLGMPRGVGDRMVGPHLPEFLRLHPDLVLDLRVVNYPSDAAAAHADMLVLLGWPRVDDMIVKRIAQTRFLTCAAPSYWRTRGLPGDPEELSRLDCLTMRVPTGVVLDVWKYKKADEIRSVEIKPRLISEDRDLILQAAIQGAGIVRLTNLTVQPFVAQGLLQPVLEGWEGLDAPPIYLLYHRRARTSARIRTCADFLIDLFARLDSSVQENSGTKVETVPMPAWWRGKWAGPLSRRLHKSKRGR